MSKFKKMLLGVALALPLAAISSAGNGETVGAAPPGVEIGSQSQYCCWVYHMGMWYCIQNCY